MPGAFVALFLVTGWPASAAQPARVAVAGTEALSTVASTSSRHVDMRQAAASDSQPLRASLTAPMEPTGATPAAVSSPVPVAVPSPVPGNDVQAPAIPGPSAAEPPVILPAATPTPSPAPWTAIVVNRDYGNPRYAARFAYTLATATFTTVGCQSADTTDVYCIAPPPAGGLLVRVCAPGCSTPTWQLMMQAGIGQALTVGTYSNIRSYRNQPSDAVFWLSGEDLICPNLPETVTVEEISTDAGGNILSFAASFNMTNCPYENWPNANGEIRINSSVPWADKTVSATAIDFANQTIGNQGPTQTVTVTSAGTKAITLGTAGFTGPGASEFKLTSDTCSGASLQPGATCTVGVAYKPTLPIVAAAALTIPDDTIAGAVAVAVSGTANVDVTITNSGTGSGVISVNPGGSCRPSPTCTFNTPTGTPVNIGYVVDAGTTFGGWGGSCTGTSGCSFYVGTDHAVTAAFNAVGPAMASAAGGTPLVSATPTAGLGSSLDLSPGAGVAVGLNHVVETTNAGVRVWDRSGNQLASLSLPAFFSEPLGVTADGDAKVIWDGLHGRWLASEILVDCPDAISGVEIGISRTDDPLGAWDFYFWTVSGAIAPSHGFGVSDDKVAFSWDQYSYSGGCPYWQQSFSGGRLLVVDMAALLAAPASITAIGTSPTYTRHGWRPAQGLTAGSDLHLALGIPGTGVDNAGYGRVTGTIAAGTLAISVWDMTASLDTPHFVDPARPAAFGAGPNTVLHGRPTDALWQRGTLWFVASAACTPTGDTTARTCVRVGAIQTSGSPTMAQDFMIAKTGLDVFSGGIGLSETGSLAVTWSQSSATAKGAISAMGTVHSAWDAPNSVRTPVTLATGSGSYLWGHWGEAARLAQDPLSGTDVWQAASYTNGGGGWATTVSRLQLPSPPAVTGSTFHPVTPARLLDTRVGTGLSGPFVGNVPRTFGVAGHGGVPVNATAVTGNLTVTGQTAPGWLTLGPSVGATTTFSTLNFPTGDDRANSVTVALGSGNLSAVFDGAGGGAQVQVIFDVTGYFTPDDTGTTYHALTPARLLDTRSANGLSGVFSSGVPRTFAVATRGGVPANATAVTGNLTITGQSTSGYAYLGPDATANPTSSTLNLPFGDSRANGVTVALSNAGALSATWIGGAGSTAHLIFDVTGYFTPDTSGARYVPINPVRVLDTRFANGHAGALPPGVPTTFVVGGRDVVPGNAAGVSANLTIVSQTTNGYAFLGPTAPANPASSTINAPVGDVRANGLDVALGGSGTVGLVWVGGPGSQSHFVLDVTGYWK